MGGKETLRVLVAGGRDVMDSLLGQAEGGSTLDVTLEGDIRARHPSVQQLIVVTEPGLKAKDLAAAAESGQSLLTEPWDLIVLSGDSDVRDTTSLDRESYRASMARVITAGAGAGV